MPVIVGVSLRKNDSMLRANGNLTQSWFVQNPFVNSTNIKKIFITDNNTIGTIFNSGEFQAGSTGGSADQLRIFSLISGVFIGYFFRADVQKWRLSLNRSGPDQNDVVIANRQIVSIQLITPGTKTFTLNGTAKVGVYQ